MENYTNRAIEYLEGLINTQKAIAAHRIAKNGKKQEKEFLQATGKNISYLFEAKRAIKKVAKQKPKIIAKNENSLLGEYVCSNCGKKLNVKKIHTPQKTKGYNFCKNCGQAIDWKSMNIYNKDNYIINE